MQFTVWSFSFVQLVVAIYKPKYKSMVKSDTIFKFSNKEEYYEICEDSSYTNK